jgi:hypothetical protein
VNTVAFQEDACCFCVCGPMARRASEFGVQIEGPMTADRQRVKVLTNSPERVQPPLATLMLFEEVPDSLLDQFIGL